MNHGYHVKNVDGGWKTYSSVFGSNIKKDFDTNDRGEVEVKVETENETKKNFEVDSVVDVAGLTCPMPIIKLKKGIDSIGSGQVIELQATDKGALNDLPAWARNAGHIILNTEQDGPLIKFWVQKK